MFDLQNFTKENKKHKYLQAMAIKLPFLRKSFVAQGRILQASGHYLSQYQLF